MTRSKIDCTDDLTLPIDAPMSSELAEELQQWQELGMDAWALFSYDEDEEVGDILPKTRLGAP